MSRTILPGKSFPPGATVYADGINFSIFSINATGMEVLLFDSPESPEPSEVVRLHEPHHRTYSYWHVFIAGIGSGQVYALRAYGMLDPHDGLRFDSSKVLLDPYSKFVVGWDTYDRRAAIGSGDNCARSLRNVALDTSGYDWEGDAPLRTPFAESIIYELHVGAFTSNPNSGLAREKLGTFAGLTEKIPYLQELGITAVELMPVHEFDEDDAREGLSNYWGYSTLGFFAPHYRYCSSRDPLEAINEFRDMVKACHRAGIEVILDVVFNHTAEGNELGPTLCFKGLDNPTYYILDRKDGARYKDFSGCGNTIRANHPVPGRLIVDSLRYWVSEMHVDGFRFDLASALARDIFGEPLERPPILWSIESDPVLAGTKLIVEAWDAAGLYQVGKFVNVGRWYAEWNGPFRDDVRRFIKGDRGTVKPLSMRVSGSSDLYVKPDREVGRSINFVTCHDGFTLNDLVSYNQKHNEANGENNRDGADSNYSWNCGVEGETTDQEVDGLRVRQIKNLLTTLFFSYGTPMMLMGDEVRRSQRGNNNAYCQNGSDYWFDWDATRTHAPLLRFVRRLISFAQSLQLFRMREPHSQSEGTLSPYIVWHGVQPRSPDWSDDSHSLAFSVHHQLAGEHLHVMLNAFWEPLDFELPEAGQGSWHRVIDTALASPDDILEREVALPVNGRNYRVHARSSVVLIAR